MKNIAMSLLAALIIATPAFAGSWKTEMFSRLDTDTSGELTYGELVASGCRTQLKLFKYADADHSAGLNKDEFFDNRELLGRCN